MIWPEERLWLPKRPFMKDCLMMGADTAACEGGRFSTTSFFSKHAKSSEDSELRAPANSERAAGSARSTPAWIGRSR